jgi:transposase
LSDTDRGYAARVVAAQTGMSQADAEKRVDAVYAQAKSMLADAELAARTAADNARKALAKTSIWMFVALLFGAFCASLAATIGGRQRDGLAGVTAAPSLHQREVTAGAR